MSVRPHDPGLRIHHDIRNERFPLHLSVAPPTGPDPFTPKTVKHRQYHYVTQDGPKCTGFGSVTYLMAAHPYNAPPISGDDWYARNQAFDRAAGRNYDEGATVTAALEVGRGLGFFTEYRWTTTIRGMQEAIVRAPLLAGTYWYDAMFTRDAEGIVKVPGPNERTDSGHLFTIRGYDVHRDLWTVPNTWGDGDYLIPGDLMFRLLKEEGEIAQPTEIKIPKGWKAAA
jgi:hypothetical protein